MKKTGRDAQGAVEGSVYSYPCILMMRSLGNGENAVTGKSPSIS